MSRLLILFLLLLNVLFTFLMRNLIRFAQRIRHDPVHLDRFAPVMTPRRGVSTMIVIGDSRAEAWRIPYISNLQIINRGIGGESTKQVLHRVERHVLSLQPDIVLIQVGVNDLWRLGVFDSAERTQIIHNVQQAIQQLVCRVSGQSQVILTTIIPLGNPPIWEKLWGSAETSRAIAAINQYVHTLASDTVIIFDTAPILTSDGETVAKRFQADYLHLNQAGYEQLNEQLMPLVETVLLKEKRSRE